MWHCPPNSNWQGAQGRKAGLQHADGPGKLACSRETHAHPIDAPTCEATHPLHAHKRVGTQARAAHDGEVAALPSSLLLHGTVRTVGERGGGGRRWRRAAAGLAHATPGCGASCTKRFWPGDELYRRPQRAISERLPCWGACSRCPTAATQQHARPSATGMAAASREGGRGQGEHNLPGRSAAPPWLLARTESLPGRVAGSRRCAGEASRSRSFAAPLPLSCWLAEKRVIKLWVCEKHRREEQVNGGCQLWAAATARLAARCTVQVCRPSCRAAHQVLHMRSRLVCIELLPRLKPRCRCPAAQPVRCRGPTQWHMTLGGEGHKAAIFLSSFSMASSCTESAST